MEVFQYFQSSLTVSTGSTKAKENRFRLQPLRGRTHVRIKGQNLNFYLETHATPHNIYFIRLRILPRILVHYTGVWMTLRGRTHVRIKGQNLNFFLETHATPHNIYFIRLRILSRILGTLYWRVDDPLGSQNNIPALLCYFSNSSYVSGVIQSQVS